MDENIYPGMIGPNQAITLAKIIEDSTCDACAEDKEKIVQFQNNLAKFNEFEMEGFEICERCLIGGMILLKPQILKIFNEFTEKLLQSQRKNPSEVFALFLKQQLTMFAHRLCGKL